MEGWRERGRCTNTCVYGSVKKSTLAGLWRHGFSTDACLYLRMGMIPVGFRRLSQS